MTTQDPRTRPAPPYPEIALVGRSNVGKSSLLNALVGRHRLARTSRTPGKTRTINYYLVDDRCYLVDLPGYGYAAVARAERERWRPILEAYFEDPAITGIVSLVDGRHPPTSLDRQMVRWLEATGHPTLVVLTKADKVPRGHRRLHLERAATELGVVDEQVVWFSAQTGEGRDAVLSAVDDLIARENP